MTARRTSTSNVSRTAAATAERRRRFVRQLLERFVWVIPEAPDMLLVAVVRVIAEELEFRHGAAEVGQAPAETAHAAVRNSAPPRDESGEGETRERLTEIAHARAHAEAERVA